MTGDGVNDVLALKEADIGIAMGSGSPAARAVSQFVLLDNKFATLPDIVAEGRRAIGNIERLTNLFVAVRWAYWRSNSSAASSGGRRDCRVGHARAGT
jgi:cation-transporting ATPase E